MRDGTEAWLKDIPADIDPEERQLAGRKVGVVGFGRIGQRLAELMAPFAVDLVVYDPYIPETVLQKYGAARVDTTLELANRSEVIVLCAANNEGSRHLIGREEIAALRPGCILVNVGRSSLMDMDALVERLGKGDITAMLDVFDIEPLEMDSSLRSLPNAFLTPHRGGGIMESITRSLALLTDDLEAVLEGREQKYALTESMMVSLPD
jgi:phosphoglycerate dehydrogenase-like enzyme